MHPFPLLVLLTKPPFLVSAAPPPRSDLYLPLDITNNDSLLSHPVTTLPPQSPEFNAIESVHDLDVPNTYITLDWTPHPDNPIKPKLLSDMLGDAITEVGDNIESFGDMVLPDDRDPYLDSKYAGEAPGGAYVIVSSPEDGPAYGRKLTWGNVRDVLLYLRRIMVEEGRPYEITFEIWSAGLGLIGRGGVIPGTPSSQLMGT